MGTPGGVMGGEGDPHPGADRGDMRRVLAVSSHVPEAGPQFGCPVLTPLPSFRYGGGRLGLASPPRPPSGPPPPAPRCLLLAGPAVGCVALGLLGTAARCQEGTVPVTAVPPVHLEPTQPRPEPTFDWALFWTFLRPQLLALSAAVVVSGDTPWAAAAPIVVPMPQLDTPGPCATVVMCTIPMPWCDTSHRPAMV